MAGPKTFHPVIWIIMHSYAFLCCAQVQSTPPHIIFILADDMGFNDVSFHGSPQIPTPNIDAMAASGIILNNYYAVSQCTPSRASLMTGRYAIHTGLQHYVIRAGEPTGLPLNIKIMPQYLKDLGYATHLVGKWHLGYHKQEYTPTFRGFDSFFGYWNGYIDYFDYTTYRRFSHPGIDALWGIDLHNNTETIKDFRGEYAMDVFTKKAVDIITEHNASQPLFLYFSSLACHTGNEFQPMQAPFERVARFKHIKDKGRRNFAGMVSSLDDAIGLIFEALDKKRMLNNSIVVFSSDNGGESNGVHGGQASNWPLRGLKFYLYEGGTRVPAVLWSPLLNLKDPRTSTQLMNISDWLPTLYSAAGGSLRDLSEVEGKNMWPSLIDNSPSSRTEMLYNIDSEIGMSALRKGDYKLINGSYKEGKSSWYGHYRSDDINVTSLDEWVWRNGSLVQNILEKYGQWLLKVPDTWRQNATVNCGGSPPTPDSPGVCNTAEGPCLFNIVRDPCEYENLASRYPKIVTAMLNRIQELEATAMDSLSRPMDPRADPRCYEFAYVPWLDDMRVLGCPWLD